MCDAGRAAICPRGGGLGRRVAVVGAGPAGLACAHRLAMRGHDVTVFEARPKPGGLNEFGIAAYKAIEGFCRARGRLVAAASAASRWNAARRWAAR